MYGHAAFPRVKALPKLVAARFLLALASPIAPGFKDHAFVANRGGGNAKVVEPRGNLQSGEPIICAPPKHHPCDLRFGKAGVGVNFMGNSQARVSSLLVDSIAEGNDTAQPGAFPREAQNGVARTLQSILPFQTTDGALEDEHRSANR